MKKLFLFIFLLSCYQPFKAQETFMVNGTHNNDHNYYAFTNTTIYVDYETKIEQATLLIKDGKIIAVGAKGEVEIPKNAVIYNLKGKYIYPSLIDIYTPYGLPPTTKKGARTIETQKKGAYNWNQAITPEIQAGELFSANNKQAEELRKLGFGAVLTHQQDGIMRGTSAFVTLGNEKDNFVMINENVASHLSFNKGTSSQDYPSSLMGMIALIRQTYYDANWYLTDPTEFNISLDRVIKNQKLPQIFEANDKLSILRADKLGDEFGIQYIFKGNGNEYQRINEIKATNGKLIIPINFPKAYDVEDPYNSLIVPFSKMKAWELAPYNLGIIAKNEIPFALTTADLKDKKVFFKNLQNAIKSGLSEKEALKALTFYPANFINQYDVVGSLHQGKLANFIITSDNLFSDKNIIHENWIRGKKYIINDYTLIDIRGKYHVNISQNVYNLTVEGSISKPTGKIKIIAEKDTTSIKTDIQFFGNSISISFNPKDKFQQTTIRLGGSVNHNGIIWDGKGQLANGEWVKWSAIRGENPKKKTEIKKENDSLIVPEILFPNMSYGFSSLPQQKTILIKNTTVWTNEEEGILKNKDVLIRDGKIEIIGENIPIEPGMELIDGKDKHLTAGIIDEHSHIAISRGVNECTQAVTSEVSIEDVVNSYDVNIYRQLAGGVVAAQLLHGSCNPVGGQSAIIKLKWGSVPSDMIINDADKFIKFALGENVKRSNFGDSYTKRFPQTRMGVEQVYYDAFIRAKEYEKKWIDYRNLNKKKKATTTEPRIDLELEILVEILNSKRFVSCHSYQQSEINMLMHIADSLGFTINTFTHILEGYKVADKMKAHGVGGSTFSDWWAYKFEVVDAIPYNGAIMHKQGVVTAFNSDDAEMGRRLNQEAAKAVKYGNVSEEEALKFVTLNPAKLLHLDNTMGSIKVGKDGSVVLWSDNPLSIYAKAEKTIIDGTIYYDIERDKKLREYIKKEKARLIEKMITAKSKGAKTQPAKNKPPKIYHCDTVGE